MPKQFFYAQIFDSILKYLSVRSFFTLGTMACTLIFMRVLGPYQYGKLSLVLHVAIMSGLLLSFGFSGTLAKFIPAETERDSKATLASAALGVSGLAFATAFVIFAALLAWRPKLIPVEIRSVPVAFVVYILGFTLFNVMQGIFRGGGLFLKWSFIEGLQDVVGKIVAVGAIFILGKSFDAAFYPLAFCLTIFVAYCAWELRPYWQVPPLRLEPAFVRYALTVFLGQILFILATSMDPLLLRTLLKDPTQVGYYFAGIRIPKTLESFLIAPLSVPLLYYFSHPDGLWARGKIVAHGTRLLGMASGLLSLVLIAAAEAIVHLLFGDSYAASVSVLRIYSLILFFVGTQSVMNSYYYAVNKPEVPIGIGIFTIIALPLLDWLLIPHWKSAGAALATVLSLFLATCLFVVLLPKDEVSVVGDGLKLMVALGLSLAVGYGISYYLAPVIFCILITVFKLLRRNDFSRIQELLRQRRQTNDARLA